MPDVDTLVERALVTRSVYENLADRQFRECLTATAADGSHPIMVVLADDPMRDLLDKLTAVGGIGNVVMPRVNGFLVVSMAADATDDATDDAVENLTPDCTVGVFFARVFSDCGGSYRFVVEDDGRRRESGHAELVAFGR